MAKDLLSFVNGSSPYLLPSNSEYYYHSGAYYQTWDSGNLWDAIIEYGHLTGDNQYRDNATAALLAQRGAHNDFLPDSTNLTRDDGPQIQDNWALAAMTAAERGVPNSPKGGMPRWVDLVSNVFQFQMRLFDEDAAKNGTCGGGLRYGFLPDGEVTPYDWKNSDSNGVLFNLAARLHRFTGNATYGDAATRVWDWMVKVGCLDSKTYGITQGDFVSDDCKGDRKYDREESRVHAMFLLGAAHMYNATSGSNNDNKKWQERIDGLLKHSFETFFKDGVAYEWCEIVDACDDNYYSYKGAMLRAYAQAVQVAPYIGDKVVPVIKTTAEAAVRACTLGDNGRECGFYWSRTQSPSKRVREGRSFDKDHNAVDANIQSDALSAVTVLLAQDAPEPYKAANSPNKGDDKASSADGSSKDGKGGKGSESAAAYVQSSVATALVLAVLIL